MPETQLTIKDQAARNRRGQQLLDRRRAVIGDPLAKFLLWILDDHIGSQSSYTLTFAELASEMEVDVSTVYRKAADLKARSLIDYVETAPGSTLYRFRISRSNVAELAEESGQVPPRKPRGRPKAEREKSLPIAKDFCTQQKPFANSENVLHTAKTFRTQQNAPYIERKLTTSTPPTPAGQPSAWGLVEEELLNVGIQETEKPIAKMRETGCPPQLALEVLEFWRKFPGRWSQGKLRRRLINLRPNQRPSDLTFWPPADISVQAEATQQSSPRLTSEEIRELIRWVLKQDLTDQQRSFWKAMLEDFRISNPVTSGFLAEHRRAIESAIKRRDACQTAS